MKIIIIRHADPDYQNHTLTERGFKEAEALGKYLKNYQFDKAYTSPLPRAKLTAQAVMKYHNDEAQVEDWLTEFSYPIKLPYLKKEKISWDMMPSYYVNKKILYSEKYLESYPLKKGNIKTYYDEVILNFDKLLEEYGYRRNGNLYEVKEESTKTIILFCHFGLMCVLMSHLLNLPYNILGNTFVCLPTGITTFISEEREKGKAIFRCNGFSDLSHLRLENLQPSFSGRFAEVYSSTDRH